MWDGLINKKLSRPNREEGCTAFNLVTAVSVERTVKIRDFTNWVERKGGSPREVTDRDRVRAILGLSRSATTSAKTRSDFRNICLMNSGTGTDAR